VPDDYSRQIDFGEARNYAGSSRLGNLLASITKYTENILRKQNNFMQSLPALNWKKAPTDSG